MLNHKLISELKEIEGLALLMEQKASKVRKEATKAIEKLAGVSTPAPKKGLSALTLKSMARRMKHYEQNNKSFS